MGFNYKRRKDPSSKGKGRGEVKRLVELNKSTHITITVCFFTTTSLLRRHGLLLVIKGNS